MKNIRKPIPGSTITTASGETLPVAAIRGTEVMLEVEGKANVTSIRNVNYVPGSILHDNLISCAELGRKGLRTSFENERTSNIVDRKSRNIMAVAEFSENGLFKLQRSESHRVHVAALPDETYLLWHKRLGHLSPGGMQHRHGMTTGLNFTTVSE